MTQTSSTTSSTTSSRTAVPSQDRPAGPVPPFAVVPGAQVQRALRGREREVVARVEEAYLLHDAGDSVDPLSTFLRFPERPSARIIALPAAVGGDLRVAGMKWVSSFPENVVAGVPRASAVLVLNDLDTGYPFACLEGSVISAARTAASAALAADRLSRGRPRARRVGFVGTGLIARYVATFLTGTGWSFDEVRVHDRSPDSAAGFRGALERAGYGGARTTLHATPEEVVRESDLVVFATTADRPHVEDLSWFAHAPVVLHVSLRDLAPEVVLATTTVVDDVEHCLRAGTSPHLAEQRTGNRDFVHGTLADVLAGRVEVPADRAVVFSPFGLGVLDLAVGKLVYDEVARTGGLQVVDDFFSELRRYG